MVIEAKWSNSECFIDMKNVRGFVSCVLSKLHYTFNVEGLLYKKHAKDYIKCAVNVGVIQFVLFPSSSPSESQLPIIMGITGYYKPLLKPQRGETHPLP